MDSKLSHYKIKLEQNMLEAALEQQKTWQLSYEKSNQADQQLSLGELRKEVKGSNDLVMAEIADGRAAAKEKQGELSAQLEAQQVRGGRDYLEINRD